MIAAVCGWHADHRPSANEINRRLARREQLIIAAPSLVEAYSVLTRLPSPHRLLPSDALALLEANFMKNVRVRALGGRSYVGLLRRAEALGIFGGPTYDAVIAQCALEARVETLLTLNEAHFREWAGDRLSIVVPQ